MMNIGENRLPIKCRDARNVVVKCPGYNPRDKMPLSPCKFECGIFCGADEGDFHGMKISEKDSNYWSMW